MLVDIPNYIPKRTFCATSRGKRPFANKNVTNQSAVSIYYYSLWQRSLAPKQEHFIKYIHTTYIPFSSTPPTHRLLSPFLIEDVVVQENLTRFCIYHRSKIPCLSLWRPLMG